MKVFTNVHTLFAATHLVDQLNTLGYPSKIVDTIDVRDPDVYIIYNAVGLKRLPRHYIIQQTEIWHSHFFNNQYLKTLRGSMAVWDYAEENIPRYKSYNKNVCIVSPGINPQAHNGKDIPYLFYGWIEGSERRKRILQNTGLNIKVVTNITGPDMWDLLKRSITVVNIHYYDDSPLETYRICEAISFGCRVYLYDENVTIFTCDDNIDEIKQGLKIAGL